MAFIFDQATISRVQQATDIVEIISEHLSLARKGKEMVGLCPFHEDHRPSMYVNPVKQIFKCFACGAGGDAFKFIQMRENLTFGQAVERLAKRAGIEVKPKRTTSLPSRQQSDIDPNILARANAWAQKFFVKCLKEEKGKAALQYLIDRQLSQDSIDKWTLGYAPAGSTELVNAARRSKIGDKLLIDSGLAVGQFGSLNDKFVNRLMFVITDVTARVIGFGGRTLDGVGAKYVNSPTTPLFDKSNSVYGLQQARLAIGSQGKAIVMEGYTDVIMAHQFGFENAVATLGTSFTQGHARLLKRYAPSAILVYDSDTAGLEAANRALEVCISQRVDIKIATVPEGKDPCDFLLSDGREAFQKVLDDAVDVFKFKWDRLQKTFESDATLAGRKAAVDEFIQVVSVAINTGNLNAIETGLIINRLSSILSMPAPAINAEVNKKLKAVRRTAAYQNKNRKVVSVDLGHGLFAAAQKEIVEVLLNDISLLTELDERIKPELFDVPILKKSAELIFEIYKSNPKAQLAQILTHIENAEFAGMITTMCEEGAKKGNFKKRLDDVTAILLEKGLKSEKSEKNRKNYEKIGQKSKKNNPYSIGMT